MPTSWPTKAEMALWRERRDRVEASEARKNWLRERETNGSLAANERGAWAGQTPVVGDVTGASTLVARNTVGMNARQEVNRMMPKEAKWIARPMVGVSEREGGIQIDNAARATKLGAATNIVSKGSRFQDKAERCAYDGEIGDIAFMLVGYQGVVGDVSHGSGVPVGMEDGENREGVEDLSARSKRAAKRGGVLHGGVTPYFPYFLRLPPHTAYLDDDANDPEEVNWIIREFERDVESMRSEYVNRVDYETQQVVRERKYRLPEWVESNTGGKQERRVKCYEGHYRVIAEDPENSRDGYDYWILTWIEERKGGDKIATPECIRHEKYPFDLGGFAIKIYLAYLHNDDLYGFVPGIRDSLGSATYFNSMVSMQVDWNMRNKTKWIYDPQVIDPDDVQKIALAEANDFIPVRRKGKASLSDAIAALPANPIPDSLPGAIAQMGQLTNEGSARSENQRGQSANVRTASEAQIVAQETSAQVAAKQKRFRKFCEDCIRAGMIIFTHVIPEANPMRRDGLWEIPDPANPGRFIQFGKEDLGAYAEIELDLVSQVLQDDTVTVSQGLQLLDMTAKVLQAPPDIQRKVMPLVEEIGTALGPRWEAKVQEMFRVDDSRPHPHLEHLAMIAGEPVDPDQSEDLRMHLDLHRAMLKNGPREHPDMWMRELGQTPDPETGAPTQVTPMSLLHTHLQATEELMQQMGQKIPGSPGSGPGSGRAPQAVPNPGEQAAGAENMGMPNTPGVRGAQSA